MKKIVTIISAIALVLLLTACAASTPQPTQTQGGAPGILPGGVAAPATDPAPTVNENITIFHDENPLVPNLGATFGVSAIDHVDRLSPYLHNQVIIRYLLEELGEEWDTLYGAGELNTYDDFARLAIYHFGKNRLFEEDIDIFDVMVQNGFTMEYFSTNAGYIQSLQGVSVAFRYVKDTTFVSIHITRNYVTVRFNIQPQYNPEITMFYQENLLVPDFGSTFGITPLLGPHTNPSSITTIRYSQMTIDSAIERYGASPSDLLIQNGFVFDIYVTTHEATISRYVKGDVEVLLWAFWGGDPIVEISFPAQVGDSYTAAQADEGVLPGETTPSPSVSIVEAEADGFRVIAQNNPNIPVEISNLHIEPDRRGMFISGTVTNTGSRPFGSVRLDVFTLDSQGRNIGSNSVWIASSSMWLMPDESRMWDRIISINENAVSFTVEVANYRFAN